MQRFNAILLHDIFQSAEHLGHGILAFISLTTCNFLKTVSSPSVSETPWALMIIIIMTGTALNRAHSLRPSPVILQNYYYTVPRKNVANLISCNLKKPQPKIIVFLAYGILIIIASKSVYNFASNLMLTYVLHGSRNGILSLVTATFVNRAFNKE